MRRRWWVGLGLVLALPLTSQALVLSGSGGGSLTALDEGVAVGLMRAVNCQGTGVTCTLAGGVLQVAVSATGSSGLDDPGANGLVRRTGPGVTAAYAGAACTNQVIEDLSASGVPSCVTLTSAYVDSSICTTAGVCTGYQAALGFTAENTANKSASTSLGTSNTVYPTQGAVKAYADTALALKQDVLTWGAGLTASGSTPRLATEEALAITNGGPGNLVAGAGNGGKLQFLATGAIQYTSYESPPALYTGFLVPVPSTITPLDCTNDPNGGKITVVGGVLTCAPDQGGSPAAGADGQVQFKQSGGLGAENVFTYDTGEDQLSVPRLVLTSRLAVPHNTTLPGSCAPGDLYVLDTATSGQRLRICESANTWVVQGDGTGAAGTVTVTGSPTAGQAAEWVTGTSIQGVAVSGSGAYVKAVGATLTNPLGLDSQDVGLGNVDNTSDATKNAAVVTLTNKRVQPKTLVQADTSPVAINIDTHNDVRIAELSQDTTFAIPTGTPFHGEQLTFTLYTTLARTLTFTTGTNGYAAENGLALPTRTDAASYAVHVFRWNALSSKWGYVGGTQTTARGTTGQCFVSNGPTAEPSFQSCLGGSTGVTAAATMTSGNLVQSAGNRDVSDAGIAASAVTTLTGAQNVSNKRVAPRMVQLSAASGTVTAPNADVAGGDVYYRLDLSGALTIPVPTGTPVNGQRLTFVLKSAAPQTLSFTTGAGGFSADAGIPLPTTTTGDGTIEDHFSFRYNSSSARWVLEATTTFTGPLTPGILRIPQSPTRPPTCTVGDAYMDTDAPSGQRWYLCESTDTWVVQGGGGTGIIKLGVGAVIQPTSNAARIDGFENNRRLLFDAAISQCAWWAFRLNDDYASTPVLKIPFSMLSATSGTLAFDVSVMAVTPGDSADANTDSYDTANACDDAAVPGTAGFLDVISCALSNFDSGAAGDMLRLKICRDVATDTATGDAEILNEVTLTYAK